MHRLLQLVVKDILEAEEYQSFGKMAVSLGSAIFPPENEFIAERGRCRELYEPVSAVINDLKIEDSPALADLVARLSVFLREEGLYNDAKKLGERALGMFQSPAVSGENAADASQTLESMASLALTYRELGQTKEAAKLQQIVLEARTRVLGSEHPDTLRSMNEMASTYGELGRTMEAAELFEKVLGARKLILGADHPDTLASMNDLAATYGELGRTAEAAQ